MDPDVKVHVDEAIHRFFDKRLGPQIATDAEFFAPKVTGRLAASIGHLVEGTVLYVYAAAPYALYVEEGHVNWRNVHGKFVYATSGAAVQGPEVFPPEPFLRASLYMVRSE